MNISFRIAFVVLAAVAVGSCTFDDSRLHQRPDVPRIEGDGPDLPTDLFGPGDGQPSDAGDSVIEDVVDATDQSVDFDGVADAPEDQAGDQPDGTDVVTDEGQDTPADIPVDQIDAPDVPPDIPVDVPPDVPIDIPIDVPPDVPLDIPVDVPPDVPIDILVDVPPDVPIDIPVDVPPDVPMDIPIDVPDTTDVPDVCVPEAFACDGDDDDCDGSVDEAFVLNTPVIWDLGVGHTIVGAEAARLGDVIYAYVHYMNGGQSRARLIRFDDNGTNVVLASSNHDCMGNPQIVAHNDVVAVACDTWLDAPAGQRTTLQVHAYYGPDMTSLPSENLNEDSVGRHFINLDLGLHVQPFSPTDYASILAALTNSNLYLTYQHTEANDGTVVVARFKPNPIGTDETVWDEISNSSAPTILVHNAGGDSFVLLGRYDQATDAIVVEERHHNSLNVLSSSSRDVPGSRCPSVDDTYSQESGWVIDGSSALLAFQSVSVSSGCPPASSLNAPYIFRWTGTGVDHLRVDLGLSTTLATDPAQQAAIWIREHTGGTFSYLSHAGSYALERASNRLGVGVILDAVSTSTYFGILSEDQAGFAQLIWSNFGCQ